MEDKADVERQQTLSAGEGDLWKKRQMGRDNRHCLLEKGICGRQGDGERQQTLSAGEGDLWKTRQMGRDNRHCLLEKGICGRQGRWGETTDIVCWRRGSEGDKADRER